MQAFLFLIVLCLAVALGVIAVVAIGMRGLYSEHNPKLANHLARVAKALNGDARPPAVIEQLATGGFKR